MEIILSCPDIKAAASTLKDAAGIIAEAIMRRNANPVTPAPVQGATATAAPVAAPVTQAAPVVAPVTQAAPVQAPVAPAPAPASQPAPTAPTAQATPAAAPVTAPSYTVQDLMAAGAALIQGDQTGAMRTKLGALLQQYGVKAATDLTAEQIPTFAQALRGLGAKL